MFIVYNLGPSQIEIVEMKTKTSKERKGVLLFQKNVRMVSWLHDFPTVIAEGIVLLAEKLMSLPKPENVYSHCFKICSSG